jgi:hypothetical protein
MWMNWENVIAQKLSQIEKNKNRIMLHDVSKLPKNKKTINSLHMWRV